MTWPNQKDTATFPNEELKLHKKIPNNLSIHRSYQIANA